jgi:hypothetical protein
MALSPPTDSWAWKFVAQYDARIEIKLCRIIVHVAALCFVEPVLFRSCNPRHLGLDITH